MLDRSECTVRRREWAAAANRRSPVDVTPAARGVLLGDIGDGSTCPSTNQPWRQPVPLPTLGPTGFKSSARLPVYARADSCAGGKTHFLPKLGLESVPLFILSCHVLNGILLPL
ncbi:hypothetical protein J6590_099661 [Homalodisca vitripennis]|nr:hypothetical protein J6590_099661 [Homalodisca vitripennis]